MSPADEAMLTIRHCLPDSIIAGRNSRATRMGPMELTSMVSVKSRGSFSSQGGSGPSTWQR